MTKILKDLKTFFFYSTKGTSKVKESTKQVMFSDGIRPGGDLTELDGQPEQRNAFRKSGRVAKRVGTPPG